MDHLEPNHELFDHFRALRAERGLRFALCTNNVREWEPLWRPKLPIDEVFDVVVDSAFVGTRKPEPEIYAITLERLGRPRGGVRVPRRPRGERRSGARSGHARHRVPRQRPSTGRAVLTARLGSERLSGWL